MKHNKVLKLLIIIIFPILGIIYLSLSLNNCTSSVSLLNYPTDTTVEKIVNVINEFTDQKVWVTDMSLSTNPTVLSQSPLSSVNQIMFFNMRQISMITYPAYSENYQMSIWKVQQSDIFATLSQLDLYPPLTIFNSSYFPFQDLGIPQSNAYSINLPDCDIYGYCMYLNPSIYCNIKLYNFTGNILYLDCDYVNFKLSEVKCNQLLKCILYSEVYQGFWSAYGPYLQPVEICESNLSIALISISISLVGLNVINFSKTIINHVLDLRLLLQSKNRKFVDGSSNDSIKSLETG